jgi:hypothetical protein
MLRNKPRKTMAMRLDHGTDELEEVHGINAVHSGSVAEIKDCSFVTRKSCFEAVDRDLAAI